MTLQIMSVHPVFTVGTNESRLYVPFSDRHTQTVLDVGKCISRLIREGDTLNLLHRPVPLVFPQLYA